MRKNRTKHEAKKPRLAKRALALCFALIFVCSCLLPAFANSEGTLPNDPLTMVEPQQDEQQPTDPVLLNEGGTDSTEGNEQHQTPTEEPKPVNPPVADATPTAPEAAAPAATTPAAATPVNPPVADARPQKLIQTGQLNWPVPLLAGAGAVLMAVGIVLKKRKDDHG